MDFKLIGSPCGQHGPYTFYKALKYSKNGKTNILALSEFFFVKLWNDSDLVTIGELQLLWEDKNSEQTLASLRLYILPENTPEGRSDYHGEHEVLAITEKVVLRVEDLLTWITEAADWSWGLSAIYDKSALLMPRTAQLSRPLTDTSSIDLTEVEKEKDALGESHWETQSGVVVLSYPRYCRYRGIVKRLEGVHSEWLKSAVVAALGGFAVPCRNTRILFCKETFDYPDLEGHELLCNHLAPKLKGRPRKKRKLLDVSAAESSDSDSSSDSSSSSSTKGKPVTSSSQVMKGVSVSITGRPRAARTTPFSVEREFLARLHAFMRTRQMPISRVPTIGFKELNLYKLWGKVRQLGGYDTVTSSRLWKYIYEEMGGDQSSTSAATCCRRHYEKLLLPYERFLIPKNKNLVLAKLKKYDQISITAKSVTTNARRRNLEIIRNNVHNSKPNIYESNKQSSPLSFPLPIEIVDLSGDDSPVKKGSDVINLISDSDDSLSPTKLKPITNITMKKQKLDILKEGGLEVTPIPGVADVRLTATEKPRSSVIQPSRPSNTVDTQVKNSSSITNRVNKQQVSITITPDVSHMMSNNRHAWSLGNHAIYGNPKEVVRDSRPTSGEVLDLRTKSGFGSNLEITLVPPTSTSTTVQNHVKKSPINIPTPPRSNLQKPYMPPRPIHKALAGQRVPPPSVPNGRGSAVPSVSISVQQKKKTKAPVAPHPSQTFLPFKAGYPVMDPVYLSAFYSGLFTPFSPSSAPQQVQMYKEMFSQHNLPDSFPRLLQDGQTSISLVNQTPTPPSK